MLLVYKPDYKEIIRTIFFPLRQLCHMAGRRITLVPGLRRIFKRAQNMASYFNLGRVKVILLDCDRPSLTQKAFNKLRKKVKARAEENTVLHGAAIRLHQLRHDPPPEEDGVLMVYTTGVVRQPVIKKSILEVSV